MDTPEDRFYNPARINAWFAVSAALVLAASVASILSDHYDREWKDYQESFHDMERDRAREALALERADPAQASPDALRIRNLLLWGTEEAGSGPTPLTDEQFEAAVGKVKSEEAFAAGAELAARALEAEAESMRTDELVARVSALEAQRDAAETERFKAEKTQRELKARVDEYKSRMDHAEGQGESAEAEELHGTWETLVAREAEVHAGMDGAARRKGELVEAMKEAMTPLATRTERARKLDDLADVSGAERKISSFVAESLRDFPLLNMFAPVTKIEQRVYPDLKVDYNFAQNPRVDRCMSCHMGIDKVKVDPKTGEVTPLYTAGNTPRKVFRTHPRPELYVSSVSKHSIEKVGCTVCHEGLGRGLTFTDAYHTPDDPAQEREWREKYGWHQGESWNFPMLPMKYVEASCLKCHGDQKDLNPEDRFAKEIPYAPKWNRGLRLIERHGCFGCHKIDGLAVPGLDRWIGEIQDENRRGYARAVSIRKTGPSLLRVASKWVSKDAAWNWVWNPWSLRPTTNMPRFFEQPNNSGIDEFTREDYTVRTRAEVWALVTYLWKNSEPWTPEKPPVPGDAARGKALFGGIDEGGTPTGVGCLACHTTKDFPNPKEGGNPNTFGPDLSTVGSKVSVDWLYTWIKDPGHYWEGTRMPRLGLTDQVAADIAAYLSTLRDPEWEKTAPPELDEAMVKALAVEAARAAPQPGDDPNPQAQVEKESLEQRLLRVGKRTATRYACFACHEIKGFEGAERIGTELGGGSAWGSKDVDRLDFGVLEDPVAVATYAKAWGTDIIPEREDGKRYLPKRKPEWAWLKLKSPRIFDAGVTKQPLEKLVMPNFRFTDDEAEAIVTVLLSLQSGEIPASRRRLRDSREILAEKKNWIVRQYNCTGCHTVKWAEDLERWDPKEWDPARAGTNADAGGKSLPGAFGARARHPLAVGGDIRPWLGDKTDHWPPSLGGEGFVGEGTRVQPSWLFSFLRDPSDPEDPGRNLLRFWMSTRMPTFPLSEQEVNALVQGFAAEDRVPFPFEFGQARELPADEREPAKALFTEFLQCSSCHPSKASTEKPSGYAPDLSFARDRLRYQWVKLWLEDPGRILPGTAMPPFWLKKKIEEGHRYLKAPNGTEHLFSGDAAVQLRKVADYVFLLGKGGGDAGTR